MEAFASFLFQAVTAFGAFTLSCWTIKKCKLLNLGTGLLRPASSDTELNYRQKHSLSTVPNSLYAVLTDQLLPEISTLAPKLKCYALLKIGTVISNGNNLQSLANQHPGVFIIVTGP